MSFAMVYINRRKNEKETASYQHLIEKQDKNLASWWLINSFDNRIESPFSSKEVDAPTEKKKNIFFSYQHLIEKQDKNLASWW